MLLNKFLFPAPTPAHYTLTSHGNHLFWLPDSAPNASHVPCMFYSPSRSQDTVERFIIWCHGNGVDIGTMHHTMHELTQQLHAHIVIFEFPSYGLCTTSSPNQKSINAHAERVYSFVRNTLQWPSERIVIYGHSIGTGVACHIAATQPIGALILQSPYTSISNLVSEKVGALSLLISTSSWNNLDAMKHITCPVLFIHGEQDTLIPSNHSHLLYNAYTYKKEVIMLQGHDHNSISDEVIIMHVRPFLEKHFQSIPKTPLPKVRIDEAWRKPPQEKASSAASGNLLTNFGQSLIGLSKASTNFTASTVRKLSGRPENKTDENEQQ